MIFDKGFSPEMIFMKKNTAFEMKTKIPRVHSGTRAFHLLANAVQLQYVATVGKNIIDTSAILPVNSATRMFPSLN